MPWRKLPNPGFETPSWLEDEHCSLSGAKKARSSYSNGCPKLHQDTAKKLDIGIRESPSSITRVEHLQLRQKETQNLSEQHLFSNTAPGFEPSKTTSDYLPASTTFAYLRHSILLFQKISSKTQFSAKLPMTKLSTAVTAATGFRKESFSLLNVLAFTLLQPSCKLSDAKT